MQSITAVALVVLALAAFGASKNIESKFADKDFLIKQKFILDIFQHIYQDDVFITKYDASFFEYKPWDHVADYNSVDKVMPFFDLWQNKPMMDDEIFSIMYERHVEYAQLLARLFYHAKDWDTFTRTVFWARMHVNKQLFIYSMTLASLLRADLEGIVLPAPYEIHPWYFFDTDTLEAAEKYKMHGFHKVHMLDNIFNVVIKSNYSNVYGDVNYDHSLAYFLEDIGLNSFYYYFNMDYPYFAHGPEENRQYNNDRRGEFYIYIHQQLLARYYLERLSNDMGEIEYLNVYEPVETGHYNGLRYYPGVAFPNRDNNFKFTVEGNFENIWSGEVFAQRIADYIDKNKGDYMKTVNELGNILQGNADSIDLKYYGSLDRTYRHMLNNGRPYGKYQEWLPSTFMHYETSMRDPLFFRMYKDIISFYYHFTSTFPEYTKKDLMFEGVKLEKVTMPENLVTYFDYFDSDISNVVNVEVPSENLQDELVKFGRNSHYDGHSYVIKARQHRLNHKPFEFQLDVTSDKAQKAVVKVFVGPKYDENGQYLHLDKNYRNFFELDHFLVDLVAGQNMIKRNSQDFTWYVDDKTTYLELYRKVMDAYNTDYKFPLNQMEAHCGVPNRLMLPKGKTGGMNVQFFYMVYAYHEPAIKRFTGYNPIVNCGIGYGSRYVDSLPFGFPFNRPVKHDYYFNVDNVKFYDIKIFHQDETTNVV